MSKKAGAFLLFFIAYTASYAQKTLSGTITEPGTKAAVPGALIYIPEFQRSTSTDDKGKYFFDKLGSGVVKIQITSVGYKSRVETVNLSVVTEYNSVLEPSTTELEQVTVTSNYGTLPDNIPFSANSIPQSEIRKYRSPSVAGNLSYQPGIDRITIGNGIGKPVIRGLSFNQIMLYSQGTRIENQQWDDHHDLGLTDAGVGNVEIVRGPAALIYGADALGGALIFIDEKPAAAGTTTGDLRAGYASNMVGFTGEGGFKGTGNSGLFYGLRLGVADNTSYLMGKAEDVEKDSNAELTPFAPNSKFNNMVAKGNVGISKGWGVSKISYSYLAQQIGIIEDEGGPNAPVMTRKQAEAEHRNRKMEAPYQDVTTQIVSLENTILTGKSKVNINAAYQSNDRSEFEPHLTKANIGLLLKTSTYDAKWTSDASKNFGFIVGSQGTFLKNLNFGLESLVPDADVIDVAGYGLFRYDHRKLNLLAGVRYDQRSLEATSYESKPGIDNDTFIVIDRTTVKTDTVDKPQTNFKKDYTPVSLSLGAAYKVNEHLTLKLNGATGYSAPNYAQLATFGKHEGTFRFERGDENLKVEQNAEADLGFIWENEFLSINGGVYINMIKDYIYIINTGDTMRRIMRGSRDTLPAYDYRQDDATLAGAEFSFDIHPKNAKWFDFKTSFAFTNGTLDKGGNLPYIPANKLINEVKLSKNKMAGFHDLYLAFVVSNYFAQNNVAEFESATRGYTLLDTHIGGAFHFEQQKVVLNLFCTNLLNTGYYNHLSLVKYIGVRDMGRNIGVQIQIPFGAKG